MTNSIPLTFRAAPLPENYSATPEEFKNDIVARLYAESSEAISFFASGSVAPTSDVGPWLKNGLEWWVWDSGLGTYVPQEIPQVALKYIASNSAPDPSDYIFWIELDGSGKAVAIKYYSGGAWKDIYEDKFAAVTASVASYPAQGVTAIYGQILPTTNSATKLTFPIGVINPSPSPYNTVLSRYIAPVTGYYNVSVSCQIDNLSGTASSMEIALNLYKNGSFIGNALADLDSTPSPVGDRWSPGFSGLVSLIQGDYIEVYGTANDGVGSGFVRVTVAQFSVNKVG